MFAGMNYRYAGFRGYDVVGDRELFGSGLMGADAMVPLHHPKARMIPIGDYTIEGPEEEFEMNEGTDDRSSRSSIAAVDMIYTSVPVLWRAYRETGDPMFRDVAVSHCDRHLDWTIREDGRRCDRGHPRTLEILTPANWGHFCRVSRRFVLVFRIG